MSAVNTDPKKIDEVLSRGVEDVIVRDVLKKEMLSGKQLSIYLGTDPTGSDLHLGHATIHRKLRDFQELGHKVTLVVGDFTVLVGDHSDKDEQRLEINRLQIQENMNKYKEQFGRTVDINEVEIVHNSKWLSKMDFNDVIALSKVFTLQQMVERDAFQKRMKEGKPVGFDELLYPMMQGYDAYMLKTDIQIGGTDQLFNLQAGRKIMEHFGVKPQSIITCPLLVGNDGRKMGKSFKNFISINSSAKEKFFGIMGIVDEIIIEYFITLTRVSMDEILVMKKELEGQTVNPMELKLKLAYEVTKFYHNEKEAQEARNAFKNEVQEGHAPTDIAQFNGSGLVDLPLLLVTLGHAKSKGEARRLVEQKGVRINDHTVNLEEIKGKVEIKPGSVINSGKKFAKII